MIKTRMLAAILCAAHALWGEAARLEPYRWRNVEITAGGFVPGIQFHPAQKGLAYCRTDIGGSYRLDPGSRRWTAITDIFTPDEWNLTGTEAVALDPSDPRRLYLAVGTYVREWSGMGALLRSSDQGRTWERVNLPFQLGANEDGRGMGERLAVDPRNPERLLLASRVKGLWQSLDRAATWRPLDSFPVRDSGGGRIGLSFVTFDPKSPAIYVGVAEPAGKAGIWRSKNGAGGWEPLKGGPAGMMPHHGALAADGALYSTWADGPGPNGMTKGAVWRFEPASGQGSDITPLPPAEVDFGFCGLALDAHNPGTLMVATSDRWAKGDEIFRSLDRGATWKPVGPLAERDWSDAPYLYWGRPRREKPGLGNWVHSLQIDPFNPDRALYGTGAMIIESLDLTNMDKGLATHWRVAGQGVEEMAVLDLESPPQGAPLHSSIGDVGGFVHWNPDRTPYGMLDPLFTTGTSIDFAQSRPEILARAGRGGHGRQPMPGCFSEDGGKSWRAFRAKPGEGEGGDIAVSADGRLFVWTLDNHGLPHWSGDRGGNWSPCRGLEPGAVVVADRVNPRRFYALQGVTLFASVDMARSFQPRARMLEPSKASLWPAPDREGDLWLASEKAAYRSQDGGATLQRLGGADSAEAFGFGKAAPGRRRVSVYMAGSVGSCKALYRTDDEAATWLRLNGQGQQWGWVGKRVTGDPRIFGRVYVATNGRGIVMGEPTAR